MKKFKFFINFLIIFTLISCDSESNQSKSNDLFNKLIDQTNNKENDLPFEGDALIGSLSGQCQMVLNKTKKDDSQVNIVRLRYLAGLDSKTVDETYTLKNLVIKNKEKSWEHGTIITLEPKGFEKFYVEGDFEALKSSVNGGAIETGSGSGKIVFLLDSLNKKLDYYMFGTGDFQFQGDLDLNFKSHFAYRQILTDSISTEMELYLLETYMFDGSKTEQDENFKRHCELVEEICKELKVKLSKKEIIKDVGEEFKIVGILNDWFSIPHNPHSETKDYTIDDIKNNSLKRYSYSLLSGMDGGDFGVSNPTYEELKMLLDDQSEMVLNFNHDVVFLKDEERFRVSILDGSGTFYQEESYDMLVDEMKNIQKKLGKKSIRGYYVEDETFDINSLVGIHERLVFEKFEKHMIIDLLYDFKSIDMKKMKLIIEDIINLDEKALVISIVHSKDDVIQEIKNSFNRFWGLQWGSKEAKEIWDF